MEEAWEDIWVQPVYETSEPCGWTDAWTRPACRPEADGRTDGPRRDGGIVKMGEQKASVTAAAAAAVAVAPVSSCPSVCRCLRFSLEGLFGYVDQ